MATAGLEEATLKWRDDVRCALLEAVQDVGILCLGWLCQSKILDVENELCGVILC